MPPPATITRLEARGCPVNGSTAAPTASFSTSRRDGESRMDMVPGMMDARGRECNPAPHSGRECTCVDKAQLNS